MTLNSRVKKSIVVESLEETKRVKGGKRSNVLSKKEDNSRNQGQQPSLPKFCIGDYTPYSLGSNEVPQVWNDH